MELPYRKLNSGSARATAPDDWRRAQDRMLLYLQALRIPPEKCLSLAHRAFEQARAHSDGEPPIPSAMRSLRGILAEQGLLPSAELDFKAHRWCQAADGDPLAHRQHLPCGERSSFCSVAHPPLRRGRMSPAPMDFKPWRSALPRWWRKAVLWELNRSGMLTDLLMLVALLFIMGLRGA